METKHSSLPWSINPLGEVVHRYEDKTNSYNMTICTMGNDMPSFKTEPLANAEFIVRACNAHYELVTALEECIKAITYNSESEAAEGNWALPFSLVAKIYDALNKAKKDEHTGDRASHH